ncbi:hypothetical protein LCGC14_0925420 [marine sediment metagenome]|uniref:Helix-turn-helix domain-containing protein n=1 Tax=marine sediment metagenome TaxID=412755 RepID=A0A0F9R8C7_9ZZZZ
MNSDYLSITQVANLLNVHRNTVVNWVKRGEIPARKFGKKLWRILRSDVEKMGQGNG